MNILFSRDLCAALVLTFAHFLWIGTLIAIVTSVVVRRQQSSRTKYAIWLTGLLIMAGSPLVTFTILQVIPVVPVVDPAVADIDESTPPNDRPSQQPELASDLNEMDRDLDVPSPTTSITKESPFKGTPPSHITPVEIPKAPAPAVEVPEAAWWRDYAPLVTSLYLIGVALMGLRLLLGLWGGHKLRYQSELVTQRWMLDALQRQADALGLILVPAMAYCERVTVPTVLGILQPMILLPMTLASGLTPEQIESVLAHELAHLRRYDHLVNLLQCVIESLLFFHPAVWWLSRRVRDEREHCCDDLVIASGAVPLDYAASLLRVAELSREAEQRARNQRRAFTAASLFATGDRPSTLRQRIARLLGYQTELHVRAIHPWVLFCLAACCVASIGVLSSMTWNVLAEINRDHSQTTVIVEWSAMVDESVINEIRALKSNSSSSSTETGTETIRCSAEELRLIVNRRLNQPKATTLGNRIGILRSRPASSRRNPQVLSWNFGDTLKSDAKGPNPVIGWNVHGKCWIEEIQNAAKLGVEADIGSVGSYLHIARKTIKFEEALADGQAVAFAVTPPTSDSLDGFRADQWKPTLIFVYEACEVPANQVDLLKPVVRAKDWIERGASEFKKEIGRISEWRSHATQEFATAHNPEWTRELPDGGTIELLGIGRPQRARLIWWDPSGNPISGDDPSWGVQFPNELTGIVRVANADADRRTHESDNDLSKRHHGRDTQFAAVPIKKSDSNDGTYTLKVASTFGPWTAEGKVAARDGTTAKINSGEFRVANVFDFSDRIFHVHCDWKVPQDTDIDVVAFKKDGKIVAPSGDRSVISHDFATSMARGYVFEAPLTEIDHLLIQTRRRHWTEFTGFATEPAVVSKPQQFVAKLPNGLSVELVGLAEMGKEDKNWWKPNGELLDQVPAHKAGGMVSASGQEMRRTLVRVHGATSHLDVTTNMSGERAVEATDSGEPFVSFVGGLGFTPSQNVARVEVGVATVPLSPWRRIDSTGKRQPGQPNDPIDHITEDIRIVSVSHPRLRALGDRQVNGKPVPLEPEELAENDERRKQTEISFLPPVSLNRLDFQLMLIDTDGRTHTKHSSSYFVNKPEVRFTFNVPLERVARFEYRLRPYQHWVTFDNVSVHPGKITDVKETVASLPTPKPPHYIANLPDGRSVEFVGITKNTAAAKEGWKPDGRPISDVGYWPATNYISGNTHGSFTENGEHPEPNAGAIDLLFRFRGLKAQPSITFDLATKGSSYSHLPLKEPYELRVSAERRDPPPPDSKWTIPDGEMRVGLTDEPWGKWLQISPTGEVLNPLTNDDLYRSYYEQIQIIRTEPHERAPNKLALVLRTPQAMSQRFPFEMRGIDPDEKSQWVLQWEGKGIEGTDLIEGRWGLATPETKPLTRFEFRLRPYRHWVTFTGVSVEPGKESDVKVKAESVNDNGKANLEANNEGNRNSHPITVSGRAIDQDGNPIPGAKVYVVSYGDSKRLAETKTDADGHYKFHEVSLPIQTVPRNALGNEHGAFEVFGSKEGKAFAWRPLKRYFLARNIEFANTKNLDLPVRYFADDSIVLDLKFAEPHSIHGRIVDEQGSPIAGATVLMLSCEPLQNDDQIQQGTVNSAFEFTSINQRGAVPAEINVRLTDDEGRFKFTDVPGECLFRLHVAHPNYASQSLFAATTSRALPKILDKAIRTGEIALTFGKVREVPVQVLYGDNERPAPNVHVSAGGGEGGAMTITDDKGLAVLKLPAGEYMVQISPSYGTRYLRPESKEKLVVGEMPLPKPITLRLPPGCSLDVTILDADTGLPIPDVDLWMSPAQAQFGEDRREVMFRSFEPPALFRVDRPKTNKDGNLLAIIEPGEYRFGAGFRFRPVGYQEDRTGQVINCAASQTIKTTFKLKRIEPANQINVVEPKPLSMQAELERFSRQLRAIAPKDWTVDRCERAFRLLGPEVAGGKERASILLWFDDLSLESGDFSQRDKSLPTIHMMDNTRLGRCYFVRNAAAATSGWSTFALDLRKIEPVNRIAKAGLIDSKGTSKLWCHGAFACDVEIGKDGRRVPILGKVDQPDFGITHLTKFLVVGELPDPTAAVNDEEKQAALRHLETFKELQEEARQHHVPIVSAADFAFHVIQVIQDRHGYPTSWIKDPNRIMPPRCLTTGEGLVVIPSTETSTVFPNRSETHGNSTVNKVFVKVPGSTPITLKESQSQLLTAGAPTLIKPTDEQLQAAIKVFEDLGGSYESPSSNDAEHTFRLGRGKNQQVTNEIVPKIPNLPFAFGLYLNATQITANGLRELAKLDNLVALYPGRAQMTDDGLKELARFKNLVTLHISDCDVTESGLKQLANLQSIRELSLPDSPLSYAWLGEATRLPHLATLRLSSVSSDEALKSLGRLQNLKTLVITQGQISDAGWAEIATLGKLSALYLPSDLKLTAANLKQLAKLENLTTLSLQSSTVTDDGIAEIAGLRNLKRLDLSDTNISDAGLKHVRGYGELEYLRIESTRITDLGLKELARLKHLKRLYVGNNRISDRGVSELIGLKNLVALNLYRTDITDRGLKHIAQLPKLTFLDIRYTGITAVGLKELSNLERLTSLLIAGPQDRDEPMPTLQNIALLKNLTHLIVWNFATPEPVMTEISSLQHLTRLGLHGDITDAELRELAGSTSIQNLDINSRLITDEGLQSLANLHTLNELHIRRSRVTLHGKVKLQEALPRCDLDVLDIDQFKDVRDKVQNRDRLP